MKAIVRNIKPDTLLDKDGHADRYTGLMAELAGKIIEVSPLENKYGWYVQQSHDNWCFETNWHISWLVLMPLDNDLLAIAKDMYAEIETRCTQEELNDEWESETEPSINQQLIHWFDVIKTYDPSYLEPLDECVPMEDR